MTVMQSANSAAVGISVSGSPDLPALGLSDGHLRDAAARIALGVMASGKSLAYGGDLRQLGLTEFLSELVGRYRNYTQHAGSVSVTNYLAWPVHVRMISMELESFCREHGPNVGIVILALDGECIALEQRLDREVHEPREDEWSKGLTAMRSVMCENIVARIVLGGRTEGYKGAMPGIAEEACLSLEIGQPVFVLGGFGGCARDIAETIGLADRRASSRDGWSGQERICQFSPADVNNGLTLEENRELGRTPHIAEAVTLVCRGLRRICVKQEN